MELLNEEHYSILTPLLNEVTINNLFACAVVERKVKGQVFVDQVDAPAVFYVVHPYGMSLLMGDCSNAEFNKDFKAHALNSDKKRTGHEWMQTFPRAWDGVLEGLFKDVMVNSAENEQADTSVIELNTRVNFQFSKARYLALEELPEVPEISIVRTDKQLFRAMKGSVVPSYFWKDEDDFWENGLGFSLLYHGELAATAYSAFIQGRKVEFGIETVDKFRRKGLAARVCRALIAYCIAHGDEPVWACRLENTGSYALAQQIGFEVKAQVPYYRLAK